MIHIKNVVCPENCPLILRPIFHPFVLRRANTSMRAGNFSKVCMMLYGTATTFFSLIEAML